MAACCVRIRHYQGKRKTAAGKSQRFFGKTIFDYLLVVGETTDCEMKK